MNHTDAKCKSRLLEDGGSPVTWCTSACQDRCLCSNGLQVMWMDTKVYLLYVNVGGECYRFKFG